MVTPHAYKGLKNNMIHKNLITIILTAMVCMAYQVPVHSSVYKWTDDSGQIHYSDQPNKPNAEEFSIRNNTTTKPREIKKDETKDEPVSPVAAKTEEPKIHAAEKRRLCQQAKSDISAISNRGRMREVNAKGEYSYLTEKQRQQRISTAKKKQSKYCR